MQVVNDIFEQRDEQKISEKRLFSLCENIISKMDKSLPLYTLLMRYSMIEQLMLFKACLQAIHGYRGCECNSFASDVYDNLSDVAHFMENIFTETYHIFKDKVLDLDDDSSFRSDPNFVINPKTHHLLLGSKNKNQKSVFKSRFCKHLKHSTFKQELFLDETIATMTQTLSKAISKQEYMNVVKRLKEAKLPTGIVSLLHGYPGTGKTATVYEMSKLTKRDVLQVDISNIRDKYVGESEKRLKAIFEEYERAKKELKHTPILLFNEADALISQRLSTNDSVDVMNNTMQNILLEELEKFDGIFFATTNLIDNMDNAFNRRFLYKIEFSKPSKQTRAKIWKSKLPDLSNEIIASISHYELSGGQIENVARKCLLDAILNLKEICVEDLKKSCTDEIQFKEEKCSSLGFI